MTETRTADPAGERRTVPPFRADHVGSLLRPERLLRAREEHVAGVMSAEDLRAVEDEAIRDAVRMQRDVGLQSATDGECRRGSWHMDFIYRLGGIETVEGDIRVKFRNAADEEIEYKPAAIAVTDRVSLDHTIFAGDFRFLAGLVDPGVTPKLTIPSPNMVLNDPRQREAMEQRGEDSSHLHETYVSNINRALAGRPPGLTVTTHLCRGNFRSSWAAEGGYDFVAETLFGGLDVDGFFLEYDDARSGGFEPLRFVGGGKMVVLGLVTTKRAELESKDELKRRIEASRRVPLEQLCLSPQCGFSSTVEGNTVTYDDQVRKLALVVETAAEVWG